MEARSIIKRCCNANEKDACIFVGNGTTWAIDLLIKKLRLQEMTEVAKHLKKRTTEDDSELKDDIIFC